MLVGGEKTLSLFLLLLSTSKQEKKKNSVTPKTPMGFWSNCFGLSSSRRTADVDMMASCEVRGEERALERTRESKC